MKPYFEDNNIVIYHSDYREVIDSLEYDTIITDPPYGVYFNYNDEFVDNEKYFLENINYLIDTKKPLITTCSLTKLSIIPKPKWIGVWHKPLSKANYKNTVLYPHWEPILFYNIDQIIERSDVYQFNPSKNKKHPTTKPVELYRELICNFKPKILLDPFMGSGTILRAAKDLNTKAIGIEISEEYCEIAAERMSQSVMSLGV